MRLAHPQPMGTQLGGSECCRYLKGLGEQCYLTILCLGPNYSLPFSKFLALKCHYSPLEHKLGQCLGGAKPQGLGCLLAVPSLCRLLMPQPLVLPPPLPGSSPHACWGCGLPVSAQACNTTGGSSSVLLGGTTDEVMLELATLLI